jgi:hypothetical protein
MTLPNSPLNLAVNVIIYLHDPMNCSEKAIDCSYSLVLSKKYRAQLIILPVR